MSELRKDVESATAESEGGKMYSAKHWQDEISSHFKRAKGYLRKGGRVVERFLDHRKNDSSDHNTTDMQFRLNLFHTNVSMMMAMLYGRVPKSDVRRRWEDANDDTGRIGAEIMRRLLNADVEESGNDFSDALRACLQDRLLPGMGVARVRYDLDTREELNPDYDDSNPESEEYLEVTENEHSLTDYVHWRDFAWGFARRWRDVPWVAFRSYMDREEVGERFGNDYKNKLEFQERKLDDEGSFMTDMKPGIVEQAEIWEIWCKRTKNVYWIGKGCDDLLDEQEDPLDLNGFFPCPEPMSANLTTSIFMPTSDFQIAQDLYNEIDLLQTRISIVTKAIKVVGTYDSSQPALQRMLKEGVENDLIPVDNWAAFAEKGGVKGTVDWFPVAEISAVLGQLMDVRQQTIEMLYQITGLSDILRGAAGPDRESAASAGQRARFASIRVQHLQEEFARFASDLAVLRAQVMCKHWDAQTLAIRSNAVFLTEDPPAIQQAIIMLKDSSQSWPWRIEIKPESIAQIDYAQLQSERTEFLNAMATYIQSAHGMLSVAPQAAPMILEMMKWGLAGFKGSQQIEGVLDKTIQMAIEQLSNPQAQDDGEHSKKMQEIQAKNQAKMQEQQQKHQQEIEKMFQQAQLDMQEIMAESDAVAFREKMQAYYNIQEKRVAEQIAARAREQQE